MEFSNVMVRSGFMKDGTGLSLKIYRNGAHMFAIFKLKKGMKKW